MNELDVLMFKAGAKEALRWFLEKHCGDVDSLQALVHTNEVYEELEKHIDERFEKWRM